MKKIILLVDDEPDIVRTTQILLQTEGFDVATATDGLEALDKIKKDMPDLVILDIMLPKVDGYKVCKILKSDSKYKNIPVLMFTARTQESDFEMVKEVKADSYIAKPASPDLLIKKVRDLLAMRDAQK